VLAEAGLVGFMCPVKEEDCEVITIEKFNPDFSVLREINLLDDYCSNQSMGCTNVINPSAKSQGSCDHLLVQAYRL